MSTIKHTRREPDGTITALTDAIFDDKVLEAGVGFGLLRVQLPLELNQTQVAGRYFLARCGAQSSFERATQWGIYFRRPLFLASYNQQQPTQPQADSAVSGSVSSTQSDNDAGGDYTSNAVASCQFVVPYQPFIAQPLSAFQYTTGRSDASEHVASTLISDPGYTWLAGLGDQDAINLMGPFGNGFELHPDNRNLLLIANGWRIAKLLPLIEVMLNRGGRITIIVRAASVEEQDALQAFLLPMLPIAVELRLAASEKSWKKDLQETLVWADQLCAALPEVDLPGLSILIREKRFHLQEGFAQILVDADLICGVGACLACVVNTANGGHTRACVNGPVFDLIRLQR